MPRQLRTYLQAARILVEPRSRRRSQHYCSLTNYEQTSHNGAVAAPTEHQMRLTLFAKDTGLKTGAGYHCRDAATSLCTSYRSARVERVPAANRQALSLKSSTWTVLSVHGALKNTE
jgi:hypothetical protein